jgi:hypothetical protein
VSLTLGQSGVEVKPVVGDTWAAAKAFWFQTLQLQDGTTYWPKVQEVSDFHLSEARIRITSAPARTSKSLSAAADTIPYIMPTKPLMNSLHWVIGTDYATNKEFAYLFEWLVDGHERHGLRIESARNNPGNGDMLIVLDYGFNEAKTHRCRAIVKGMSANNEKAMQGEEVTTANLSEAADHPSHILRKYLSTRCWKINLPTTPKPSAEWIRELIEDGNRDPSLGIEHFHFPKEANPHYNHERFDQEMRRADIRAKSTIGPNSTFADDPFFAEQFLGEWVYYTGMVLPFQRVRHVLLSAPPEIANSRKFVSLDYGYEDGEVALFWAVLPNGILVIFDEVYERHLTSQKFVEKIHDKLDAAEGADYVVGDPSQPQVARIMRDAGLNVWDRDKNAMRDRAAGFTRLRDLLTEGPVEGYPGIYVTANCKKTIAEWGVLRFREGCRNEFANGSFIGADHAADAARYFVMTRPVPQHEPDRKHDWLKAHMRKVRRLKFGSTGKFGTLGLKQRVGHG